MNIRINSIIADKGWVFGLSDYCMYQGRTQ